MCKGIIFEKKLQVFCQLKLLHYNCYLFEEHESLNMISSSMHMFSSLNMTSSMTSNMH